MSKTIKFFGNIAKAFTEGGSKKALQFAADYKSPLRSIRTLKHPVNLPKDQTVQRMRDMPGRGIRSTVGNTADALLEIGKDGVSGVPKNFYKHIKSQIKGDMFIELNNPKVVGGVKGQVAKKDDLVRNTFGVGKYKVDAVTNRGSVIVERHGSGKLISGAFLGTNPANLALADTFASGGQGKTKTRRGAEALGIGALSSVSVPAAIVASGIKNMSNKKQMRRKDVL